MNLTALGLTSALSDLRRTARNADDLASDELESGAERIAPKAAAKAPEDTGELKSSIKAHRSSIVATAEHARFVHDGTINNPPRPFIANAIHDEEEQLIETVMDSIADELGFS